MAIYNVHAGHNAKVPGANGLFSEVVEDRKVKGAVISKLRVLGHTVYDCTDDEGTTQSKNLANIVTKCNQHDVDLDISIHFNSSNGIGNGVEVLQYSDKTQEVAQNICNAIAELGFKNRGVKQRTDLYVLRKTKSPAILIECCFCDSYVDANIYNYETMADTIVKGITNQQVTNIGKHDSEWIERLKTEVVKQGFSDYPTLKKGAQGNITRLVQERLNSVGFNLSVDGIFGQKTKNAIIVFQRNRGLVQDGIVGKNTWEWLLKGTKM